MNKGDRDVLDSHLDVIEEELIKNCHYCWGKGFSKEVSDCPATFIIGRSWENPR